jgi:hypothetical protein
VCTFLAHHRDVATPLFGAEKKIENHHLVHIFVPFVRVLFVYYLFLLVGPLSKLPTPVLFEIKNVFTKVILHCGVLEFSAAERAAFLPFWVRGVMTEVLTNWAIKWSSFFPGPDRGLPSEFQNQKFS